MEVIDGREEAEPSMIPIMSTHQQAEVSIASDETNKIRSRASGGHEYSMKKTAYSFGKARRVEDAKTLIEITQCATLIYGVLAVPGPGAYRQHSGQTIHGRDQQKRLFPKQGFFIVDENVMKMVKYLQICNNKLKYALRTCFVLALLFHIDGAHEEGCMFTLLCH